MAIIFLHRITLSVLLMEMESVYFEVESKSIIFVARNTGFNKITITNYRVEIII
jgi:hypothetical protein